MSETFTFSRRHALGLGTALGITLFCAPAWAAQSRRKLVVIVCRGAMDGLSVAPPLADSNYESLRGAIAIAPNETLPFDSDFGLHPKLNALAALVRNGQARIAPAAAIPQRIRSHFEAQDLLESGGARLYAATTGWLNRAVSSGNVAALSVGAQEPLILRGAAPVQSWSPGGRVTPSMERLSAILQDLYASDAMLSRNFAAGLRTEAMAGQFGDDPKQGGPFAIATTTARFLGEAGGPSIAVLSLDGFDTHANQGGVNGQLANRLKGLDDVLAGLHQGLGAAWQDTIVIAVTEFGRTARVNGTGGTDHGTASTLILAGGALKPGGIVGDWPTLATLFENRDVAPTLDIRQVFKGVLAEHLGIDRRTLETAVFPDSAAAPAISGIVA
jgi:uncharacterized protein (DUF1501 family)